MTKTLYKNRVVVMKRIIKNAKIRPQTRNNFFLHGMFKYGDKYVVTDGVFLLLLKNEYDGITLTGEYNSLNIGELFNSSPEQKEVFVSMDEVKDFLKETNNREAFPLNYGVYCDARYLQDMLTVFQDAKIYVGKSTEPIQFISSNEEAGILMPVRPNKN